MPGVSELHPSQRLRLALWSTGQVDEATGRWLSAAARALHTRGHELHVAAPPGSFLEARGHEAGIPTEAVRGRMRWRRWMQAHSFFGRHRPHAVVVAAADVASVRMAMWPDSDALVLSYSPRRGADALTHANGNVVHLTAAANADSRRWIPYGVRDVGAPNRTAVRRELRLPRRTVLLLQIGPLEAGQEHEVTLRALASLRARHPARVPVVGFLGTGTEEARLHVLGQELGVKDKVLWIGHRKEVERYLDAADALVAPGAETPDWLVLEAWARRVPVVVAAGPRQLPRHGETGLVFASGDAESLAHEIERIVTDPGLAGQLSEAALRELACGWTEADLGADLECLIYARLVRRAASRGPRPGFFVDRDDTLMRNVPYNGDPAAVRLEPQVGRALRWVREAGWPVLVVSNQSGVARGLHDESQVHAVNARLEELLLADGAGVDAFYFCPHHPDFGGACTCRKPEPGMLLRAAGEHGVDLGRSIMVGDAECDLEAGRRAGTRVLGYAPRGGEKLAPGSPVATGWLQLVRHVLAEAWSRT